MKHLKNFKIFESLTSDRRAFDKWESKLPKEDGYEGLFDFFIRYRDKLLNKDIFYYNSRKELQEYLNIASLKSNPLRKFEKDVKKWIDLNLNCDILYKDDDFVFLHANDFESEYKLSSGCNICSTSKVMYDSYTKNGVYFIDILDIKNNARYFAEFRKNHRLSVCDKGNGILYLKKYDKNSNQWIIDRNNIGDIKIIDILNDIVDEVTFKSNHNTISIL